MSREIYWTDQSELHIAAHQVDPDEVEDVVYSGPRYTQPGRGGTTEVYGQTDAGRYLFVVLSDSIVGGDYVVTARTMNDAERRLFNRKARRV